MSTFRVPKASIFDLAKNKYSLLKRPVSKKTGKIIAGLGALLGDEVKAGVCYAILTHLIKSGYYTPQEIVSARFSGGKNRMGGIQDTQHPVYKKSDTFTAKMLPSGMLVDGVTGYIGAKVLFSPDRAIQEIEKNVQFYLKDTKSRYKVSSLSPLHIDLHDILGRMYDVSKYVETNNINLSTGNGIWYSFLDAQKEYGLKTGDMFQPEIFRKKLEKLVPEWQQEAKSLISQAPNLAPMYDEEDFNVENILTSYTNIGEELKDNIIFESPRPTFLTQQLEQGKLVYIGGSQSTMLHRSRGLSTEFFTSTDVLPESIPESTGIDLDAYPYVLLGLFRFFTTRHGPGPLPTELSKEEFKKRWANIDDHDAWELPFRAGYLDIPLLRASHRVANYSGWAASWLDGLDGLKDLPVCNYYTYNGDPQKLENLPAGTWTKNGNEIKLLEAFTDMPVSDIVPHIECLPGWAKRGLSVHGISAAEHLPGEAWELVRFIESELNMPDSIVLLRTSKDNQGTIFLREFV